MSIKSGLKTCPRFRRLPIIGILAVLWLGAAYSAAFPAGQPQVGSIVGRWHYKDAQQEIQADFNADGTFFQITTTAMGPQQFRGRYSLNGQLLQIQPDGFMVQQITCRFQDPDTMALTYPTGMTIVAKRVRKAGDPPPGPAQPSTSPGQGAAPKREAASPQSLAAKPARVLLQRVWEPNERAYTVLVPKGWKTAGGIFNVSPLKANGPGNSISPKNDFAVKSDDHGSIMFRWLPTWNYADLTFAATGFSFFKPGQYYQGMPVRVMIAAKQFLTELIRKERPQAGDLRILAEDAMAEVTNAFNQQAEPVNRGLRQIGIAPMRFESLAMLIEYEEGGRRFRESLLTTIADNRHGAFQWSNENTVMFRAPAAEFESWKPVLDMIQTSREGNPQWMAAVVKAVGERAKMALETQAYINKVANEIVENRRRTNAEIRHEDWLFITGQEEYKNPFTGDVERGTSAYRYRWENNQGEILYTDQNGFNPNRTEEFNTKEWKRSEVWDRKR